MIEQIAKAMNELGKEGLNKVSADVPDFAKDLEPKEVKSFAEANKPFENLDTINEDLKGEIHPETEVPFKERVINLDDGVYKGVFPEFESDFQMELDQDLFNATDRAQFKEANNKLAQEIKNNPEFKEKFTERQLEQIEYGKTPEGYTWHHSEEPGVMELVKTDVHGGTGHTGGRAIWGGGQQNRY
ncbi:HNH endonuclease [Fuchsiella alkaliacetigena]|uniref:HNH endonuclease n=1 Tax=Fuchsiella alkaliacetigena TaxID=957042 RepID=UPI00200B5F07|nr:HNH endonuclease [Fuchsiella alkaliacetigena]MCK8823442.1 HNH endonuclease [Fuchsiella alkaliacetigena]